MILTIKGEIFEIGEVYEMSPNRKCQRVTIKVSHQDARIKTDYYSIFIYGADIAVFWDGHKGDFLTPAWCTVTVKLNGRMLKQRNTLTLSYKKVVWNYL